MKATKWIAIVIGGIAAADLTTGNTDKPLLPDVLGNVLTPTYDVVLIAIAIYLWMK